MTTTEHRPVVSVDRSQCVGSGMCHAVAPVWFRLVADRAHAIQANDQPDQTLLDAAEMCPMAAITVYRPSGGERVA